MTWHIEAGEELTRPLYAQRHMSARAFAEYDRAKWVEALGEDGVPQYRRTADPTKWDQLSRNPWSLCGMTGRDTMTYAAPAWQDDDHCAVCGAAAGLFLVGATDYGGVMCESCRIDHITNRLYEEGEDAEGPRAFVPHGVPIGPGWARARIAHMHNCVYFVRHAGMCKIGGCSDLYARIAALKTSWTSPAELIATAWAKRMEQAYHDHFAAYRVTGEWFDISDSQVLSAPGVWPAGVAP